MRYFKNTELARLYHISEKTVRNWVEAARDDRLDLQLVQNEDRYCIANTPQNLAYIEQLVERGKKYKNSRGFKTVTPTAAFYRVFASREILGIIADLDLYHEIPYQYSYFDGGADAWDEYASKLSEEKTPNLLNSTLQLLEEQLPYLDDLLDGSKINIIDIGPGNAFPVKQFLAHFVKTGQVNRYIGIDISSDMLKIAERNIHKWFGNTVTFEGYTKDIGFERFADALALDAFDERAGVRNIILFLGGTIANLRNANQALTTIHDSMSRNDIFIIPRKLDSPTARRYFDYAPETTRTPSLAKQDKFMLDLLNISPSYYTMEQFFDDKKRTRRIQIRFNVALAVAFELEGKRKVVEFYKGDTILLWKAQHQTLMEMMQQLYDNHFRILRVTRTTDQDYALITTGIRSEFI